MKLLRIIPLVMILLIGLQSKAQDVVYNKETFKVWGVCDMCKTLIDKTVKSIEGVKYARWSLATKKIKVKFDINKTSTDSMKKALSAIGYDNEKYKATEEDYNNLHKCCKYDRN